MRRLNRSLQPLSANEQIRLGICTHQRDWTGGGDRQEKRSGGAQRWSQVERLKETPKRGTGVHAGEGGEREDQRDI